MKKMNRYSKMIALLVAIAAIMFACVKDDFDTPPIKSKPIGDIYTIAEVKDFFTDPAGVYTFTEDASVYATVTMDNETDNSYRTFFIQDNTAGIAVYQDVSGGVYVGDSVRVYLKNLVVMKYSELFQINSITGAGINVDSNLVKQGKNNKRTPEEVTIKTILSAKGYWQGRLVKVTDVQFVDTDTAKTLYFEEIGDQQNENKILQDSLDKQIIVRTSSYATFANGEVPNGSGSIIAIVGQFNDDMQLTIRKYSELEMDNERFDVNSGGGGGVAGGDNIDESFDSGLGVFTQYSVTGSQVWSHDASYKYAKMTGYDGSRYANEDWLISPQLDFSSKTGAILTFRHTTGFADYTDPWNDLQVVVSTDYTGTGDPNLATWIAHTFDPSPVDTYWTWVDSGDVDLSDYDGESNVYIAFKYVSNTTNCATWEIDDVLVE